MLATGSGVTRWGVSHTVSTSRAGRTGEQPDDVAFPHHRAAALRPGPAIEILTAEGRQECDALLRLL